MSAFDWNDTYCVNIQMVDKQHKSVFKMINNLYEAIQTQENNEAIAEVIRNLLEYTQSHFEYEETLMEENGFPGYEGHKAEHERLLSEVKDLVERHKIEGAGIAIELIKCLNRWWWDHIVSEDKKYSAFLNNKGIH